MQKSNAADVWITVAHRSGMRIYHYDTGARQRLTLVQSLAHPEGALKDKDLGSDQPGRSFDSIGGARHSLAKEQSPSEHISEVFAKLICKVLEEGRVGNQFSKLVLIAGPSFLGLLRQNLSQPTSSHIVHTLNKDLVKLTDHELQVYLEALCADLFKKKD